MSFRCKGLTFIQCTESIGTPIVSHSLLVLCLIMIHCIYVPIAEDIINPGSSTTNYCGLTGDCVIICNATDACSNSVFHVYNYSIVMHCTAVSACESSTIITSDVNSFHLTAVGDNAFRYGLLSTSANDGAITVECRGRACFGGVFHYASALFGAVHVCGNDGGCQASFIHAMGAVSLYCNQTSYTTYAACQDVSIVWPLDPIQSNASTITAHFDAQTSYVPIFTIHHKPNIICSGAMGCSSIYAYFVSDDTYCSVVDNQCMDDVIGVAGNDTFVLDTFKTENTLNFSDYQFFDQNIVLILSNLQTSGVTFTPPTMHNPSKYLFILCIHCDSNQFNLQSVQNVVWTGACHSCVVYGPVNHFIATVFAESSAMTLTTYHLSNTANIVLNNLYLNTVYLGDNLRFNITCGVVPGSQHCDFSDVHSDVYFDENVLDASDWNIQCLTSRDFTFHFPNRDCPYLPSTISLCDSYTPLYVDQITNPGQFIDNISCGTTGDCLITCDTASECKGS
eukprot:1009410_1